jgi:GNAT superfamily N-acetyltransferase
MPVSDVRIETSGIPGPLVAEYDAISIAFDVTSRLVPRRPNPGLPFTLTEQPVEPPYVKDYDAIGERPRDWAGRFDTSGWALLLARMEGECVGGAAIAWRTSGVDLLDGRSDLALLWDIRIAPAFRRRGVGRRLFEAAEDWARARGCRELKVETQNINVAACRFYAAFGCELRAIRQDADPQCPGEAQFLWYKALGA